VTTKELKFKRFSMSKHVDVAIFQELKKSANTFLQKLLANFQKTTKMPTKSKKILALRTASQR